MKAEIRCTLCGAEFTNKEITDDTNKCPKCGTESTPCAISEDVEIKINWHELRVLTIWAENWAKYCDQKELDEEKEKMLLFIMTISQRLQKQFPDKTPLTLFGEIKDLRKNFDIETDIDDDNLLGL